MKIREEYIKRKDNFTLQLDSLNKKITRIVHTRLIGFIAVLALIYFLYSDFTLWLLIILLILITSLIFLVKYHSKLNRQNLHLKYLIQINEDEIAALEGDYSGFDNGKEFIDFDHPNAYDMDIFGDGAIFQYINRSASVPGKYKLAKFLTESTKSPEIILLRQESIKELKEKLDLRQNFLANGYYAQDSAEDKAAVLQLSEEPVKHIYNKFLKVMLYVLPTLLLLTIILYLLGKIPYNFIFYPAVLQLGYVGLFTKAINKQHEQVSRKFRLMEKYSLLLKAIEEEEFSSGILKENKQKLLTESKTAGAQIKALASIIQDLDNRANVFGSIVMNAIYMRDIRTLLKLEKWKLQTKDKLSTWFQVIEDFDALSSFANFSYNHPNFVFPEIEMSDNFVLNAENAGHPLLAEKERVNNEININGWSKFMIITGANMAGKSTYLRTVGLNLILAKAGAPVCAKSFRFYPIDVYTSMRTKDSLQKHESFFYAELKRLKNLIDELNSGRKLFVILDEILKGTNSLDQQTGARALIEQLLRLNSTGIIATHDLGLGKLVEKYPGNITNQCFEIEIENDQLVFDYKLKPGISNTLNATFLMKKMGITV